MDAWISWQLRIQENLRQSASSYRKQAIAAANLSAQNQILLDTLRLKDEFVSLVGQELRTPLSAIKTALTLLGNPHLEPNQRQHYMDMIARECDRQGALIQGALTLLQIESKLLENQPMRIQLGDILDSVVGTYQSLAQSKGIKLACSVPKDLPAVSCPEPWLHQIIVHLLSNSLRFTQNGGQVWMQAYQLGTMVRLECRDTGVGISSEEVTLIFDHFYRGRNLPAGEPLGAGLGLTIVQQLLRYCGGSVSVESQPHKGSTFRVRLPIAP